jgi:hypothetical protein
MQLGGGGTFKKQDLVRGSELPEDMPFKRLLGFWLLLLSLFPGHHEVRRLPLSHASAMIY